MNESCLRLRNAVRSFGFPVTFRSRPQNLLVVYADEEVYLVLDAKRAGWYCMNRTHSELWEKNRSEGINVYPMISKIDLLKYFHDLAVRKRQLIPTKVKQRRRKRRTKEEMAAGVPPYPKPSRRRS